MTKVKQAFRVDKLLRLHTGDNKAAFSRFVLPFRWEKEKAGDQENPRWHWEKQRPIKERERKKYFTRETGKALYERACWLELKGFHTSPWARGVSIVTSDNSRINARMSPPRMVLFEWENKGGTGGILQSGFLLVDVYLEPDERWPILDDLLTFNEFFRYIDSPYNKHDRSFKELFREASASFLDEDNKIGRKERDDYFDRWSELLKQPVKVGGEYCHIVSNRLIEEARNYLMGEQNDSGFLIHADDRAYVWTAASMTEGIDGLQALAQTSSTCAHDYGHWIKLLNIDKADDSPYKTHHNIRQFEREWAKDNTYCRWEEWGTWYGFTYHSGAALAKEPNEPPNIVEHFSLYYFDIALLLLYLRVTLFRFSNQLGMLSEEGLKGGKTYREFRRIREQFAHFSIRYQFPILSNQQQGIEMYSLARKRFDLDELYEEVKAEIHETHEFLEMDGTKNLSISAVRISEWGIPLAAAALLASVFGMNVDDFHFSCFWSSSSDCGGINWEAVALFGLVFVTWYLTKRLVKKAGP